MSTYSQDEFAAVEGEEFFKSLVKDVAKDVEDADADADSGDLEPQLEAEIGSELQINARAPAMQAQAEAQMRQTPTTAIAPTAAGHLVPSTLGTVEQSSSTPAQILDSTRELDVQLQFQQQRQQPPPAQVRAAVAAESSPNDGSSPAQFAVHQSDINNFTTSTTTTNTNNVTEPIPAQEPIFAAQIKPQDSSTTSSEHISHFRNPSHHSTIHTGTSTVTSAQQYSQPLPPSVPSSTPVEYYIPTRRSPGDGTAQVPDSSGVPAAAINTEEGLGIQTSYAEVPAPAPIVVSGEGYEDLGEFPEPQRDMPVLGADPNIAAEAEVDRLGGAGDNVRQIFELEEAVQQQEQQEERVDNGGTDTKANNQVTVTQGHPRIEAPSVQQTEATIVHGGPATQSTVASSANIATLQEDTIQQHAHAEIPTAPQEIVWGSLSGTPLAIQTPDASANVELTSPEKIPAGIADRGNANAIQPTTQVKTPPQQDADSLVMDRRPSVQVSVASAETHSALQQDAVVQQRPPNEWLNPQGDADNLSLERISSVQESVANTADEPIITEVDLEERWKAMGIDDTELLDEMLPDMEEDVVPPSQPLDVAQVQQPEFLTTQPISATTAAPYLPAQQSAPTAAFVPAQPQPQSLLAGQRPPSNPYIPQQAQPTPSASRRPSNTYAPHQPSVSELVEGLPIPSPVVKPYVPANPLTPAGLPAAAASAYGPRQPQVKQPSAVSSFVDKAKEGYQSPYDLPTEFSRPVRRSQPLPPVQRAQGPQVQMQVPGQGQGQGQGQVQDPRFMSPPPQQARAPLVQSVMSPPPLQQQRTQPPSAQAMVPPQQHPKPSSLSYKPTQPQPRTVPAPVFAPPPPTSRNSNLASPPPSAGNNYQFPRGTADQEAKRSDGDTFAAANAAVIASMPSPPVTPPGPAPATAQAQLQSQPQSVQSSARSKYAPQSTTTVQTNRGVAPPPPPPIFSAPVGQGAHARTPSLTQARAEAETRVSSPRERETMVKSALSVPPPMPHAALQYSPSSQHLSSLAQGVVKSPTPAFVEPDYIVPDDGQEFDPLQRWKGAPVFKFGLGGTICSTFPRQVPKYMAGHALPKMKPMPGEIRVEKVEEMAASAGIYIESAGFPGPLASKSKKKDVVAWMSGVISRMEEKGEDAEDVLLWKVVKLMVENDGVLNGTPAILDAACAIVSPGEIQIAHEDDGTSANQAVPEVTKSDALARIRNHLMAGLRENAVWEAADNKLWGHALLLSSSLEGKSVWKRVIEEFVQRELSSLPQAQPLAALYEVLAGNPVDSVDQLVPPSARAGLQMMNKTGSARTSALDGLDQWRETVILILRNMSPDGPQALIEISQLLASFGRTAASHICVLFAKCLGGAASFSGPHDPQAIVTLLGWDHRRQSGAVANNLSSILLTEIYEFATSILNAQSAPTTLPYLQAFKLLHAERLAELGDISRALEYCDGFASTLKKSGHRPSPYYHRMLVSRYEDLHSRLTRLSPDGVAGWMSKPSMTKVSGSVWAKFQNFVAGEDQDDVDSSSLVMKEEIGILSSPAQHVMSGQSITPQQLPQQVHGSPAPTPFPMQSSPSRYTPQARHTPSSSRELSLPQRFASSANLTQYTPGANDMATVSNHMRKVSSLSQFQTGRASLDSNTTSASRSTSRYIPTAASEIRYTPTATIRQTTSQVDVQGYPTAVPETPGDLTTQGGPPYEAVTPSSIGNAEAASSGNPNVKSSNNSPSLDSPLPTVAADGESVAYSNEISEQDEYVGYVPPTSDFAGPSPSISVSESDEENTSKTKAKRRSSILDDDEDDQELLKRAAALKKAEERRKDKEIAEKANKGSEGGAQQSSAPQKKGWFSGWFGGKKESISPATVVRAKLGEENSFYYDKDLKRWVNKKDPNGAATATGTLPPPPKAPAPAAARHDSGNGNSFSPPTMPAPAGPPPMSVPGPGLTGAGAPPKMAGIRPPAMSAPPTRADMPLTSNAVSTGTEVASTPPVPRNISDANSLDDLLGAPAPMPRTHSSAKSKRKGRGYVDLMAK